MRYSTLFFSKSMADFIPGAHLISHWLHFQCSVAPGRVGGMFKQLLVLRTGHLSACGIHTAPGLFAVWQGSRKSTGAHILGSCSISPVLHSVASWDWSSVLLSPAPVKVGDHFCFLSIAPEGSNLAFSAFPQIEGAIFLFA